MKIPKSFSVGRKKYAVQRVRTMTKSYRGEVNYTTKEVTVAKHGSFGPYTKEQQFETILHEIVHAVLYDMGSPYNNEAFVEPFAKKLAKTLRTAKF